MVLDHIKSRLFHKCKLLDAESASKPIMIPFIHEINFIGKRKEKFEHAHKGEYNGNAENKVKSK